MDPIEFLVNGIRSHPYITIWIVSTVEGRVSSFLTGMLAAEGYLNPLGAYAIFVPMCIAGDVLFYFLGRTGGIAGTCLSRKSWWPKFRPSNAERIRQSLPRALIVAKITGIASKPTILLAGMVHMPLAHFCRITIPCTLILYFVYISVGYFLGRCIF